MSMYRFKEVSKNYRLIPDDTVSVLVPYSEEMKQYDLLVARMKKGGAKPDWMRDARGITIQLYRERAAKDDIMQYLDVAQYRDRQGVFHNSENWFIAKPGTYDSKWGFMPMASKEAKEAAFIEKEGD